MSSDDTEVARTSDLRRRLRSGWRDARPFVLMALTLVTVALGLWGFERAAATRDGDVLDQLYRTTQLFGFGAGDQPPPVPWQLQVARVLAPLLVGYAAIRGLLALFRAQYVLLKLRLFARRHVIVAGLGDNGFRLATALHDAGMAVVVVEKDAANVSLAGCRDRGIPVLIGDATDGEVLDGARCSRASHIVALCGHDATNLDVLAACVRLSTWRSWQPGHVHVQLENPALWRSLRVSAMTKRANADLRIEFFAVTELAARAFAEAAASSLAAHGDDAEVLIDGAGELARATERHVEGMLGSAPSVVDSSLAAKVPGDATRDLAAILVCVEDDADALARGAAWIERAPAAEVFVAVRNETLEQSLDAASVRPARMRIVGVLTRVLSTALLEDTAIEAIARARHELYVRREIERGVTPEANEALVAWEELEEALRESNRRFADSVGDKIAEVGGILVPRELGAADPAELRLSPADLEDLAREEHDRWVAERLAAGWRYTDGAKDVARRLSPLLVPWEELPEAERDKDRDGVRSLPELLAAAGYELRRGAL